MKTNSGLGTALKSFRGRQKVSLRTLSKLTGVDFTYLCRLETGSRNNPGEGCLRRLSEALVLDDRENSILEFLSTNEVDPALVQYVLDDETVTLAELVVVAVLHSFYSHLELSHLFKKAASFLATIDQDIAD